MKRDLFTIALMGLLTASCGIIKDKEEMVYNHYPCKAAVHASVKEDEPKKDIEDEIDSAKKVS